MNSLKFSVLMSIYINDKLINVQDCIDSLVNQTLLPNEIIIVLDGPVKIEIENYLISYQKNSCIQIVIERLDENKGLPTALNKGLQKCRYNLIARMDADDICSLDRFEKQIARFEMNPSLTLLGGSLEEFYADNTLSQIKYAVMENITQYSKLRSPFNHPTVVFKKQDIIGVGGYDEELYYAQDYELWCRLIQLNFEVGNIEDVILKFRMADNFLTKRSGLKYIKIEWSLFQKLSKIGHLKGLEKIRFLIIRCLPRVLPTIVLKQVYGLLRSFRL
ncbi:MAG: glycosyltransferase [Rhizobiales bacterium]|nr:glycosyltransferase [Hyphomicrobiales bacterium]NRB14956.1 glycosyltransferase [Hyphomicrobiales bacterium]